MSRPWRPDGCEEKARIVGCAVFKPALEHLRLAQVVTDHYLNTGSHLADKASDIAHVHLIGDTTVASAQYDSVPRLLYQLKYLSS